MAIIVVFGTSLLISFSLIASKAIEIKFGRRNPLLKILASLDPKSSSLIYSLKFRTIQFIQTVRYIFLVHIKEIVREYIEGLKERIAHEYKLKQDTIMGRKEITSKGSVSFYLKKIAEEKQNSGVGKIEESL